MTDTTTPAPPPRPRRKLEDLTPADIQRIGAAYGLNLTGIVGTTPDRIAVLVAYALALLFASWFLIGILAELFGFGLLSEVLVILAGWVVAITATYPLYLVNVPKLTGLITTNILSKELHVYDIGWNIKFPWERYTLADFINMQADIVIKKSRFVTSEGAGIEFDWTMQFTAFLPLLPLFVRTEQRAIEEGLAEVVEAAFSSSVLDLKMKEIRHPVTIDRIRDNLLRMLEGQPALDKKGNPASKVTIEDALGYPMEERFGMRVELGTLSPPTFDEDYQEIMLGNIKVTEFKKSAAKLAKETKTWKGMPTERAVRQVMIMNKEEGVTDESFTLDITDRAKDAAGDAARVLGPLAPAAGAAFASRVKGSKRKPSKKKETTS